WSIADELNTKRLVCPWPAKWAVPIQAYIYRMDTRLNKTAEHFWTILRNNIKENS
ncbi:hypochlorite stress DNA-binding transcriptional regulator HypT, partial [Escherichia coli]